jgi:manganese-dependent inorganic pyrophosphatase
VIGDRDDMQRRAIEHGVAMLVISNGCSPEDETLELARKAGISVVTSPLDSYVTGRMITLAAPCTAVLETDPLTVRPDDLLDDIAESVKDVHYRAAVAVDTAGKPVGLVSRSALVSPQRRRVILVDHAEPRQSVPGIDEAEIVEILDHHHIGSIETANPVRAIFDPVGSTATLVLERYRFHGLEPDEPIALLLLSAVLSDTVILNSPTTTERDHEVVAWLEEMLDLDAEEYGREMFEATTDISDVPAKDVVVRDAKHYDADDGRTLCIAQIEVVGDAALERKDELLEAMDEVRERRGYVALALMITDIAAKDSTLLVSGDRAKVSKALGEPAEDGTYALPGVMSRKKQVAPKLLAVF